MAKQHECSPEFKALAEAYDRQRQEQGDYVDAIAKFGGALLRKGASARQTLDACLEFDRKSTAPVGRASVEFTLKWLLKKHLENGNGRKRN